MSRVRSACTYVLLITCAASGGQPRFQGWGPQTEITNVSPDGAAAVGSYELAGVTHALLVRMPDGPWALTYLMDVTGHFITTAATAISAGGETVVGNGRTCTPACAPEAFRWTQAGGFEALAPSNSLGSRAWSITGDGRVTVGDVTYTDYTACYRWVVDGESDSFDSRAWVYDVSQDAAVMVGQKGGQTRWDLIGDIFYATSVRDMGAALAVSADGTTVVGYAPNSATVSGSDLTSPGWALNVAYDVTGDGSVIVGEGVHQGQRKAYIWTPSFGARDLKQVLEHDYCLDLTGWQLTQARAISDDGLTIGGNGIGPDGESQGWTAVLTAAPAIAFADPPSGIIDARADRSTTGLTFEGIDRFEVTFSVEVVDANDRQALDRSSFQVLSEVGGAQPVLAVNEMAEPPNTYEILIAVPIPPGQWTTLYPNVARSDGLPTDSLTCARVEVGFLPGDADGSRMSTAADVLELVDHLNGALPEALPEWRCDMDHSHVCNVADVLRLIDLLNGVNTARSWLGQSLPEPPSALEEVALHIDLELSPTMALPAGAGLERCIEFELFSDCANAPITFEENVRFGGLFDIVGELDVVLEVAKGTHFQCINARDRLHTLWSSYTFTDDDVDAEGVLHATFAEDPFFGGNWLLGGNLDGYLVGNAMASDRVIDIIDFAAFVSVYPQDDATGSTPCGTDGPHGDFNGDGLVDLLDFTFITRDFLMRAPTSCCPGLCTQESCQGRTSVTVAELVTHGLTDLTVADLDGDGDVDMDDMSEFISGSGP